MKNIKLYFVLLFSVKLAAQNIGIKVANPQEDLHIGSLANKVSIRLDSRKSDQGVNYFTAEGSPSAVANVVGNPTYNNWVSPTVSKIQNADNNYLSSEISGFLAPVNILRVDFSFANIPTNATITNATIHVKWYSSGAAPGGLFNTNLNLFQASTNTLLLGFGQPTVKGITDQNMSIDYQERYSNIIPQMINNDDLYLHIGTSKCLTSSTINIDNITLEIEYSLPAPGENISWIAGVKNGKFNLLNGLNAEQKTYLTIDEGGTTTLKGLKIEKNAGAGKVLTSNNDGRAFWADAPSTPLPTLSINDLADVESTNNNLYIGANTGGGQSNILGNNTAIGIDALSNLTTTTSATNNTAIGYNAMKLTTGDYNVGVGASVMFTGTNNNNNTAMGYRAMNSLASGNDNVAIGYEAAFYQGLMHGNVAIGYQANKNTEPGLGFVGGSGGYRGNTAVGYQTMLGQPVNTFNLGAFNTAVGNKALYNYQYASNNVAIGNNALFRTLDDDRNTAVGDFAMADLLGNDNTALGKDAGKGAAGSTYSFNQCNFIGANTNLSQTRTNVTLLGYGIANAQCTGDNQIILGNTAITQIRANVGSITTFSDARLKTNINENVKGLAFITKLRPVTYQLNPEKLHQIWGTPDSTLSQMDFTKVKERKQIGFLAQEVEQAAQAAGFDFPGLETPKTDKDVYSLRYADFIIPLVKAVQEQQVQLEQKEQKIQALEAKLKSLEQLETRLNKLEAQFDLGAK